MIIVMLQIVKKTMMMKTRMKVVMMMIITIKMIKVMMQIRTMEIQRMIRDLLKVIRVPRNQIRQIWKMVLGLSR